MCHGIPVQVTVLGHCEGALPPPQPCLRGLAESEAGSEPIAVCAMRSLCPALHSRQQCSVWQSHDADDAMTMTVISESAQRSQVILVISALQRQRSEVTMNTAWHLHHLCSVASRSAKPSPSHGHDRHLRLCSARCALLRLSQAPAPPPRLPLSPMMPASSLPGSISTDAALATLPTLCCHRSLSPSIRVIRP